MTGADRRDRGLITDAITATTRPSLGITCPACYHDAVARPEIGRRESRLRRHLEPICRSIGGCLAQRNRLGLPRASPDRREIRWKQHSEQEPEIQRDEVRNRNLATEVITTLHDERIGQHGAEPTTNMTGCSNEYRAEHPMTAGSASRTWARTRFRILTRRGGVGLFSPQ